MQIEQISGYYHVMESGVSLFAAPNIMSTKHMLAWMVSGDDAVVDCVFGCDENGDVIINHDKE